MYSCQKFWRWNKTFNFVQGCGIIKLLKDFPNFELTDNPVSGIGCQSTYDNTEEVVYFSKKDYQLRPEFKGRLEYFENNLFKLDGRQTTIELGDPTYFKDASWTVSFDPKSNAFISFHDWHPDLAIPTKDNFLTNQFT